MIINKNEFKSYKFYFKKKFVLRIVDLWFYVWVFVIEFIVFLIFEICLFFFEGFDFVDELSGLDWF